MATTSAPVPGVAGSVPTTSFGRGRGRGRGLRANAAVQQQQVGAPTPLHNSTPEKKNNTPTRNPPITSTTVVPSPPSAATTTKTQHCSEVVTIMNKLNGLSEAEVMRTIVPVIDGLDSQKVIEDLVQALSEKALLDAAFAVIAAKISLKLWDNESIHKFVRNPLLTQTQGLYNLRHDLRKENKYRGLCTYLAELFKILRIRGKALRPMGVPVLELLKGLIEQNTSNNNIEGLLLEDVKCFYQGMTGIGEILMECLEPWDGDAQKIKDKLEEVVNLARQLVISSNLEAVVRCRLVQVIELHAGKWKGSTTLDAFYDDVLTELNKGKKTPTR